MLSCGALVVQTIAAPPPHAPNKNIRSSKTLHIPPLCHLRRRSSLWSSYLRPYSENILIRHYPVLCKLLVGSSLRHLCFGRVLAEVRKAFGPILFKPRESSLSRYLVLNAFSSATGKAKGVARSMRVREKPHPGRGAWSSRYLRCSSCIQHCQKLILLLNALWRFFVKIFKRLIVRGLASTVYRPITNCHGSAERQLCFSLIRYFQGNLRICCAVCSTHPSNYIAASRPTVMQSWNSAKGIEDATKPQIHRRLQNYRPCSEQVTSKADIA